MEVPERMAMIGGGILLSSLLVFTLKGQISSILPKAGSSNEQVYQGATDIEAEHGALPFSEGFIYAQKRGWTTGDWGSSKYYIDDKGNMHIGQGTLQGTLYSVVGDRAYKINSITLDEKVQAPQNSSSLFMGKNNSDIDSNDNQSIQAINGLDRLDTSHVTDMDDMFYRNRNITHLNVNNWDTSHVQRIVGTFARTNLSNLDLSHWDTKGITNYSWTFYNDEDLHDLNLSGWDSSNGINMSNTFQDTGLNRIDIGSNTKIWDGNGLQNTQWNNDNNISNMPNQSHPGTWTKIN